MYWNKKYDVPIQSLHIGEYTFKYLLNKDFFINYDCADLQSSEIEAEVKIAKKNNFLQLSIYLYGYVFLVCDRCANVFKNNIWDEFSMMVKMVDNPQKYNQEEQDPDVYYIGKNDNHINLANWLYEFAYLSIPLHKICKSIGGEEVNCNAKVLKYLEEMKRRATEGTDNILSQRLQHWKTKHH